MAPVNPCFRGLLVAALALPASAPRAQDMEQVFQQGLSAYQQADGLRAGELWEPCARAGHPDCQYALGVLFDDGAEDWPADIEKAIQWLTRAARQGHVDAQIRLGFLYSIGREGLVQEIQEAYVWFSLAAAGGSQAARAHRAKVMELMTEAELEQANLRLIERGIRYQVTPYAARDQIRPKAGASAEKSRE